MIDSLRERSHPYFKPHHKHKAIQITHTNLSKPLEETFQMFPPNVQGINISCNKLEDIPHLCKHFICLTVLNLERNSLTTVPDCISDLSSLKELNLSLNKLTSIDNIDFHKLSELEHLFLRSNQLKHIPETIENLCKLRILRLDYNKLTHLPYVFHKMTNLECLGLDGNQCGIPEPVFRAPWIISLHVRTTGLTSLPEGLRRFKRLELLAIGGNEIKVYPLWLFTETSLESLLLGDESEVCTPPPAVCCSPDNRIANMMAYFESLSKSRNAFDERMKVLVIGDTMAGKTSLVQSILLAVPTLTEEEARTACVEIHEHLLQPPTSDKQDRSLTVNFWDFGGHECYYFANQVFLTPNALVVVTLDAAKYLARPVENKMRTLLWIENIVAHIPGAKFLIVATHIDQVPDRSVLKKMEIDLLKAIQEQEQKRCQALNTTIKKLETQTNKLKKQMRKVAHQSRNAAEKLLKNRPEFPQSVCFISNQTGEGHNELLKMLGEICTTNYPNLVTYIPKRWKEAEQHIQLAFQDVVTLVKFRESIFRKFPDTSDAEFEAMLDYFSKSGIFCYFPEVPTLSNLVFINPNWLISIFKAIFQPLQKLDQEIDELTTYTEVEKSDMKCSVGSKGMMSETLLSELWKSFITALPGSTYRKQNGVDIFLSLLQQFSLCFEVPSEKHLPYGRKYLFPMYLAQSPEAIDLEGHWPCSTPVNTLEITFFFVFSGFVPAGFFERMSCILHSLCPKMALQYDKGAYGRHSHTGIKILLSLESESESHGLTIKARYVPDAPNHDDPQPWRKLWEVLLPLILRGHKMLSQWPGLVVSEHTACPNCVRHHHKGNVSLQNILACPQSEPDQSVCALSGEWIRTMDDNPFDHEQEFCAKDDIQLHSFQVRPSEGKNF